MLLQSQAVNGQAPVGPPADMWSLGCILAEVALQRPLFPAHTPAGLLRQVGCRPWQAIGWCGSLHGLSGRSAQRNVGIPIFCALAGGLLWQALLTAAMSYSLQLPQSTPCFDSNVQPD